MAILATILSHDECRTRIVHAALIIEGRKYPALIESYGRRVAVPRPAALSNRLRLAVARGKLVRQTDFELLVGMLILPILRYTLAVPPDRPMPKTYIPGLVDPALRGGRT